MNPHDTIERSLRAWPVIILFMLLGGLIGLALYATRQPVYEAAAVIATSIDYSRAGYLSEAQEDNAVGVVGDVLASPAVLQRVVQRAAGQNIALSAAQFQQMANSERQNTDWWLRVRSSDPQQAAELANLWAEEAYAGLVEAHQQAVIGDGLLRYQLALENCLQRVAASEPQQAQCNPGGLEDLQAELGEAAVQMTAATTASFGMHSSTGFLIAQNATPQPEPVRNGRSSLVLAGAMIGFLAAVTLISTGWADGLIFRRKRESQLV